MATKYLAESPKFTVIDANGLPVSGGLVYVTSAGTTTPATTYSDATGTANADPVVLDSYGQCNLWLTPGLKFDIRVTTSVGVLLWTATKISSPVTPSTYFATLMTSASQAALFTTVVAPGGTITGALDFDGAAMEWAANVTVNSLISATPIGAAASNNVIVANGESAVAVAVGSAGAVMTSTDSSSWTSRTASQNNSWTSVAYSNTLGLFAAVSSDGTNRVMTSPDGTTWTNRTAAEQNQWTDVCWASGLALFVAVAQSGTNRVMYSSNGTSWTAAAAAQQSQWQTVRYSPDLNQLVALSFDGASRVMTSTDAMNWTVRTAAAQNSWYGLAWSPSLGLWVASSSTTSGGPLEYMMSSANGTTWTIRNAASGLVYLSIAWSPSLGRFASPTWSGGDATHIGEYSANGTSWLESTGNTYNGSRSVCWSAAMARFIAVSPNGSGNRVMTSADGITWATKSSAANSTWTCVTSNG